MPDTRNHRGAHPEDAHDFAARQLDALRAATAELSYLFERRYALDASLKLVGDHHQLTSRQRQAVLRAACAEPAQRGRAARQLLLPTLRGHPLAIDGFNVLITVEAMLSGAPLFRGRDGALRDLASVHGTYRSVHESEHASALLAELLARHGVGSLLVLLDRPVGNSGRTRGLLASAFTSAGVGADVQLVDRVDQELVQAGCAVASSDSWILDRAVHWVDLPSALLAESVHAGAPLAAANAAAWVIDLATC